MRVLLASYPDRPIFHPMVPLAWALRTAGHEVRFACQPAFADTITRAGLTAVPVGRDGNTVRMAELDPEQDESERGGLPRRTTRRCSTPTTSPGSRCAPGTSTWSATGTSSTTSR